MHHLPIAFSTTFTITCILSLHLQHFPSHWNTAVLHVCVLCCKSWNLSSFLWHSTQCRDRMAVIPGVFLLTDQLAPGDGCVMCDANLWTDLSPLHRYPSFFWVIWARPCKTWPLCDLDVTSMTPVRSCQVSLQRQDSDRWRGYVITDVI